MIALEIFLGANSKNITLSYPKVFPPDPLYSTFEVPDSLHISYIVYKCGERKGGTLMGLNKIFAKDLKSA